MLLRTSAPLVLGQRNASAFLKRRTPRTQRQHFRGPNGKQRVTIRTRPRIGLEQRRTSARQTHHPDTNTHRHTHTNTNTQRHIGKHTNTQTHRYRDTHRQTDHTDTRRQVDTPRTRTNTAVLHDFAIFTRQGSIRTRNTCLPLFPPKKARSA